MAGEAKGTTAHTEADGGGHSFPPFESSTFASQLVSLAIAFAVLYLIASKFALPRVGSVLDARQGAIDGDLAEAQKLKDQSNSALKAYESELASARSGHTRSARKTAKSSTRPRKPSVGPWKTSWRSSWPIRRRPLLRRAKRR